MSRIVAQGRRRGRGRGGDARARAGASGTRSASSTAPGRRSPPSWSGAGLEVRFVDGRRVTSAAGARGRARVLRRRQRRASARRSGRARCRSSATRSASRRCACRSSATSATPLPSAPAAIERRARRPGSCPSSRRSRVGPLNVNADEAAAALAVGLGADRLLFVTDVPGLLLGGAVAATIHVAEAERLLAAGELGGGIVPKLHAAVVAARGGVRRGDRRDGGGRVTSVLTTASLLPTYARHDVTFVSGDGVWLTDDDGKRYLDLARRDRGRLARALPPGAARGRARPARRALAHLEPLLDRADAPARRSCSRPASAARARSSATRARRRSRRR